MPPNPAPSLLAWLLELGITESGGMGPVPLSWREIAEWTRLSGIELPPWQVRLLRNLSVAYIAESRRAEEELCAPPWGRDPLEAMRMRAVLG